MAKLQITTILITIRNMFRKQTNSLVNDKLDRGVLSQCLEVKATIRTDAGCVREINEDASRFITPNEPQLLRAKGALLIVADGMGGHSAGEVASSMAVETISRSYFAAQGTPAESLTTAFAQANAKIYAAATADEKFAGMGTTGTALVVQNNLALAAHVGDSRLYLIRDGEIYLMTEDHSAVMEMVKLGIISRAQARTHEDKNVILRALGTNPEVEVSLWENALAIRAGDQFLLCSDGLTDLLENNEIRDLMVAAGDANSACEQLIDLAKRRGGYDNITVAILGIEAEGLAEPRKLRETREVEVAL
jgi:serine/threonine protein phosphatase PrpC